jgi:hypothetical protein
VYKAGYTVRALQLLALLQHVITVDVPDLIKAYKVGKSSQEVSPMGSR